MTNEWRSSNDKGSGRAMLYVTNDDCLTSVVYMLAMPNSIVFSFSTINVNQFSDYEWTTNFTFHKLTYNSIHYQHHFVDPNVVETIVFVIKSLTMLMNLWPRSCDNKFPLQIPLYDERTCWRSDLQRLLTQIDQLQDVQLQISVIRYNAITIVLVLPSRRATFVK